MCVCRGKSKHLSQVLFYYKSKGYITEKFSGYSKAGDYSRVKQSFEIVHDIIDNFKLWE